MAGYRLNWCRDNDSPGPVSLPLVLGAAPRRVRSVSFRPGGKGQWYALRIAAPPVVTPERGY